MFSNNFASLFSTRPFPISLHHWRGVTVLSDASGRLGGSCAESPWYFEGGHRGAETSPWLHRAGGNWLLSYIYILYIWRLELYSTEMCCHCLSIMSIHIWVWFGEEGMWGTWPMMMHIIFNSSVYFILSLGVILFVVQYSIREDRATRHQSPLDTDELLVMLQKILPDLKWKVSNRFKQSKRWFLVKTVCRPWTRVAMLECWRMIPWKSERCFIF